MEPMIVAAMISAGGKIVTSLFERWSGKTISQKTQDVLTQHYDTLKGLASDNCMRLMKRLEDGQNRSVDQLIIHLYPDYGGFSDAEKQRLRSEFEYRLFFLTLSGLVTRPTREYYITELGKAFVNEARSRRDYFNVLFD